MIYMIYCTDAEDGDALREKVYDAHREHLGRIKDRLMLGGPCPAGNGEARQGSLLVVEADDVAAARALAEADPFFKAGVWESVIVREFNAVIGAWAPKG